jgi:hypothetical protein
MWASLRVQNTLRRGQKCQLITDILRLKGQFQALSRQHMGMELQETKLRL